MNLLQRVNKIIEKQRALSDISLHKNENVLNELDKCEIKENTVLVVESFIKHGEVYPSIIKYFLDLGFDVHLYNLQDHMKVDPMVRCNFSKERVKVFTFSQMPVDQEFFNLFLNYKFIMICTILTHDGFYFINNFVEKYKNKYNKKNFLCINHDLYSLKVSNLFIEDMLIRENHIVTLRKRIKYKEIELPFISPYYLGEFTSIAANCDKIRFVSVGGGLQKNVHNFELLFLSINQLIDNGIKDFSVSFVGVTLSQLEKYITDKNKNYINVLGYTNFEVLLSEVEQAHFILYNVDDSSVQYEKYKKNGITGSYFLSLACEKPGIVYNDLAIAYDIDNFCLCYKNNDLYKILAQAININYEEYLILVQNLINFKKNNINSSALWLKKYIETYL